MMERSVKTGDIWTGHPINDDIDLEKADQSGSETRRTESSACGDGPCSPETSCCEISEGKAPEQESGRKTAQPEKDEDYVQLLALTPRADLKEVKEGQSVPAAGEGDDNEHAQGTETCTEPSPATACSGKSEEKAPEQKADMKMAQPKKDEDYVQLSALTPRADLKEVKEGQSVPAAGEGDDDEHAQGTETYTEPSPATDCSGKSEEKAPEQEAERKMAQPKTDKDYVQLSALTLRADLKEVKEGQPVPAPGEGDDDEHAQGTETCTEPSPATASSGISVDKAPEQEEQKKIARSKKDDDNTQQSTLTLRKNYELVKEEKLAPAAGEGDDDEHAQGTETGTEPSPATVASRTGQEWPTAHRKDDCDFPDQPRTSEPETQRRKSAPEYGCNVFGTWSAAAVWIMMALAVATSSLAGAVCIGTEVKLDKGEAALRCPLPVDVSVTRQSIVVKHFPTPDSADEVMHCDWTTEEADKPECKSSDGFSLVAPLTDQVVAKGPVSRLKDSGAYKCQLYPLDDQDLNPCHIHHLSDDDEGKHSAVTPTPVDSSAVTPTPVDSSTAPDSGTPGQDPRTSGTPPCADQSHDTGMTGAILGLQIIICLLLAVNFLIIRRRKNQRKPMTPEREPMNSLNEQSSSHSPP